MFQRFRAPTSTNITFTGSNEAIGPNSIATIGNQNKFLKNVAGTCTWIALPLPDTASLTASDHNKQLVFDYPTMSFVLRNLLPLYDIKGDSQRLFYYEFSASTFTAGTSILEAGSKASFNVSTLYGTMTLTDSNRAIQITNNSGGGFLIPNGKPSGYTSNFSVTYMLNSNLSGQPMNSNIQLITGNGFINNYIYALSNNVNQSYVVFDNDSGAPSTYSSPYGPTIQALLPQSAISIVTYANIDGRFYYYLNGVKIVDTAFSNVLVSPAHVYFSGNPSSSGNQFIGLAYAMCAMQDATVVKIQKVEGAMRWNSRYTGLTITLDATHPYYSTAPTV